MATFEASRSGALAVRQLRAAGTQWRGACSPFKALLKGSASGWRAIARPWTRSPPCRHRHRCCRRACLLLQHADDNLLPLHGGGCRVCCTFQSQHSCPHFNPAEDACDKMSAPSCGCSSSSLYAANSTSAFQHLHAYGNSGTMPAARVGMGVGGGALSCWRWRDPQFQTGGSPPAGRRRQQDPQFQTGGSLVAGWRRRRHWAHAVPGCREGIWVQRRHGFWRRQPRAQQVPSGSAGGQPNHGGSAWGVGWRWAGAVQAVAVPSSSTRGAAGPHDRSIAAHKGKGGGPRRGGKGVGLPAPGSWLRLAAGGGTPRFGTGGPGSWCWRWQPPVPALGDSGWWREGGMGVTMG